jgi:lipopolysaccharide export system protein LptA
MKRSEARNYARWSAGVALLLALSTGGVYLQRVWRGHIEKRNAPPAPASDVDKQSSGLTFSKVEGERKIFTVEASKSTDYKNQDVRLIEDVKITIFGKTGLRHDTMHTRSCEYGKDTIVCSGEVQMDMQSAADVERVAHKTDHAPPQIVHVQTSGLTFYRSTGESRTEQHVAFTFPDGTGEAMGLTYQSQEGALRLLKDVKLDLIPRPQNVSVKKKEPANPPQPVHVKGTSLDFGRDTKVLHLLGPAEAETTSVILHCGEITLLMDEAFRAQKLIATAGAMAIKPHIESKRAPASMDLQGDTLTAMLSPEGSVARIEAAGSVVGFRQVDAVRNDFSADNGDMDLWPHLNSPKELHLNGNVWMKTQVAKTRESRVMQTTAMRMQFSGGKLGQPSKPKEAETLAPGTIEWTDASTPANAAQAHTKLQGDLLHLFFDPQGKASQLVATGNVRTERTVSEKSLQTATARSGIAKLSPAGGWTQIDLQGNVKLVEADRNAQAGHALFLREAQTATLTGDAVARDATSETHAPRIIFSQTTGDFRAEGGVRSTDLSAKNSAVQLAPAPTHISSDNMQGSSKTGRALYTGHARLWQGDSVLEAQTIELLRDTHVLNANGNVRAVFPQSAAPNAAPATAPAKKINLWHVTADSLHYLDAENFAHLEHNVVAQSDDQKMRSNALDLFFTRENAPPAAAAPGPAKASASSLSMNPNMGSQQISRAIGNGNVIVEQGTRKATAERGEYTATDGKFVMTGGNPTIFDATQGTTSGRQLTFFLADDTIIVEAENGSRTLTKHRIN